MKTSITILALCLIGTLSFAQAPAIQWQKCLGGTGFEDCYSIQPTPDGGYIVAGRTTSNDGDVTGNHGNNGNYDAWVVKLSATGSIVWQKALGGTSYDSAFNIQLTPDGGYIVAGDTSSNDGDITINNGQVDAWVVKLSATGTLVWQKTLGGTNNDSFKSIQPSPDGGYIVSGFTRSTDGDVTGNYGNYDGWVVKLSATGTILWQKTLGGIGDDNANNIQLTADGGYIVASTNGSNNGVITGNQGGTDACIIKLSVTGDIEWQKTYGGTGSEGVNSIQPIADGSYIVAGYTRSIDGDVTENYGFDDAWIIKLTATGFIVWQKTFGGTANEQAHRIQSTPDGGYIVAGFTNSTDVDVTGYNGGGGDAWVIKLSATGTLVWQKTLGGIGYEVARSIQLTPDGGYIVAGSTNSIDGDVTGINGNQDAWVVKLSSELMATTSFASQELKIFPNPAKNILQLQTATNGSLDKITITDLTGKIILIQTTNTTQINVEPLASGMYILEANSGENKFSSKFVKE
jgi:hypothetical protein